MKSYRRFVGGLICAVLLFLTLPQAPARAQEKQTIAVMSLSSIDSLLGNVQYLAEVAGAGDAGRMVAMMAQPYGQGLDSKKPVGFVLWTDGQQFQPLGFIPVKDLKQTLALLEEQVGKARDAGNGVLEIPAPQPVFVKEQNGWAFIGQTVESLRTLPPNPTDSLAGLDKKYDIAVQVNIRNVPQQFRDMAITTLKEGVQQGLQQLPEEDAEDFELRQKLVKAQMEQIDAFVNESDQITLGWKTDPTAKRTFLDMTFTAQPGTKTAKQMAMLSDAKSNFAGFLVPDAALTLNSATQIPPEQIQQNLAMLQNLRNSALSEIEKDDKLEDPQARKAASELLGAVFDIITSTFKTGEIDGGAAVLLNPKAMTILAGFHVADGSEVEKVVRRLAELAKNEPDFPGIKFDADKHSGVTFHTMSVPIPEDEDARKVLGENLEVAIGIGERSAYVGLGPDCVSSLKKTITSSESSPNKPVPPFQLTLAMTPIMEFISSIEDNPLIATATDALKQSGGKDHMFLRGIPVENGLTYRIELEEGVLRAIGQGATMAGAGGF